MSDSYEQELKSKRDELKFYSRRSIKCAFLATGTLALSLSLPSVTDSVAERYIEADPANATNYRIDTQVRTPFLQAGAGLACLLYTAAAFRSRKSAKVVENEIEKLESGKLRPL